MSDFKLGTVNYLILSKQHLTNESKTDDIVKIVKDVGGLHAAIPKTSYLSIFSRAKSFTRNKLDEELYEKKVLARFDVYEKPSTYL